MLALHVAFSLALLALLASMAVTIKASGHALIKSLAVIALLLSLLNVGCISFYGYRYWTITQNTMPYPMVNMIHTDKPMTPASVNK